MFYDIVRFDDLTERDLASWFRLRDMFQGYNSPFFSPEFTHTMSRVRDDIWVILHGRGDEVEVVWPIQKYGRTAEPVGAPFSDYHGPIMHPEWDGDFQELLAHVGLNCMRMTGVYEPQGRLQKYAAEFDGAYITDLREGADAFFEEQRKRYPKHAKKMRRLSRKVEREVGELVFRFDDRDSDTFDELMELKEAQYAQTGRHNVLGPDWVKEMLFRLWAADDKDCQGYLHTLKSDGKLIAAEFNLTCRETIHGWIPAYNPEFAAYAPGMLLQDAILPEAAARGFVHYDLGVSAGHYKKYYMSYQIQVMRGTIWSRSMRRGLNASGERLWLGLESAGIPKLSGVAGQIRRRYDVIRSVETSFLDRMKGVATAAKLALKPADVAHTSAGNDDD